MNKATIERLAAPRAQESETPRGVVIDPASVAAISGAIVEGVRAALLEIGPMLARLAAADTVHSVDRPAVVMGRHIIEGQTAQALLNELGVKA